MSAKSATADFQLRRNFACTAACEVSTLIDVLDREFREADDFNEQLWRGVYLRLDTLVSVIISATSEDGDRPTENMAREIYGSSGWARAMRGEV